jgi:hypothetical protein
VCKGDSSLSLLLFLPPPYHVCGTSSYSLHLSCC